MRQYAHLSFVIHDLMAYRSVHMVPVNTYMGGAVNQTAQIGLHEVQVLLLSDVWMQQSVGPIQQGKMMITLYKVDCWYLSLIHI